MLYKLVVMFFIGLSRVLGVKFIGREKVPRDGALIAVANHRHWSDIVLLALAIYPRQVHFMGKSEYGQSRFLRFLMKHLGAFTVERGEADMKAIKTALGYLRQGEIVGIYPEGTRNKTAELLLPFKEGSFMLAARGKAMVVPVALCNAPNYIGFSRPRPVVIVGDAIDPKDFLDANGKPDNTALADAVRDEIEKMLTSGQDFK